MVTNLEKEKNYWEVSYKMLNDEFSGVFLKLKNTNDELNKYKYEVQHLLLNSEKLSEEKKILIEDIEKKEAKIRALEEALSLVEEENLFIKNNLGFFIKNVKNIFDEIVKVDLQDKESIENFKELQVKIFNSKNILDVAFLSK